MSIGDFSRATRLSAKTLRFYHRVGLLSPVRVDAGNGYRRYGVEQVSAAELIRTYRSLDMPLELIREVLAAPSTAVRDGLIEEHLERMEAKLEATRSAIASLRSLLQPSPHTLRMKHRSVPPTPVAMISETIDLADLGRWYTEAMLELDRLVEAGVEPQGHRGGSWGTELFLDERGLAALYLPIRSLAIDLPGRARAELLPAVDLVVARHEGSDDTIAEVYAALGRHVARSEVSADGPIRETYLPPSAGSAQAGSVTEIGWPIHVGGS